MRASYSKYLLYSPHFFWKPNQQGQNPTPFGQKATGLLTLPTHLTPPFIAISSALYDEWLNEKSETESKLRSILKELTAAFEKLGLNSFIVRSSAITENFNERGYFESSAGGLKYENLHQTIISIWSGNNPNVNHGNSLGLVIQTFVRPRLLGHFSNERRVSRNVSDWLIETVTEKGEFEFSKKISNRGIQNFDWPKEKNSTTKVALIQFFNNLSKCSLLSKRHHIEWVWDGTKIWLVQNDIERDMPSGEPPGYKWSNIQNLVTERANFKIFRTIDNASKLWKKTECIKVFRDCGLPSGDVFILENHNELKKLCDGQISKTLVKDLKWILNYPIVIRMDIKNDNGYDNVLLPRTETLFDIEQTKAFLLENAKVFKTKGVKCTDFCFLIHRFIVSKSCALAFAKPKIQKARIDSTWGIIDGLHYHPHDSFEVNLQDNSIKKQIRCKTEYLDVDAKGNWFSKKSGATWDWAESLNKNQLIEITHFATAIANRLKSPVVVMFFVDVNKETGYPSILPWFYTTEEIKPQSEKTTSIVFSQVKEVITSRSDFDSFKIKLKDLTGHKVTIKIKLIPELLREKVFIEEIGKFAERNNLPIELEGSILSHTYYILRKVGAVVNCVNLFEPKYKKQHFYKLVRDKIPVNIESKGERASAIKVDSKELLEFLKEKAVEEAFEFFWENDDDNIVEELADLFEVIRAACNIFNIKISELERIANLKNEKKGGFKEGLLLIETTESSLIEITHSTGKSLFVTEISSNSENPSKTTRFTRKVKRIHKEGENTIYLPHILGRAKSGDGNVKAYVNLDGTQLEIIQNKKGVYIRGNIDKKFINPNQLDLFS